MKFDFATVTITGLVVLAWSTFAQAQSSVIKQDNIPVPSATGSSAVGLFAQNALTLSKDNENVDFTALLNNQNRKNELIAKIDSLHDEAVKLYKSNGGVGNGQFTTCQAPKTNSDATGFLPCQIAFLDFTSDALRFPCDKIDIPALFDTIGDIAKRMLESLSDNPTSTTRYLILPGLAAAATKISAISSKVKTLKDVTVETGASGNPLFWAAEVPDDQYQSLAGDALLVAQDPNQIDEDFGDEGFISNNDTQSLERRWDHAHQPALEKRATWASRKASWDHAMISDPPGTVPNPKGISGGLYTFIGKPYQYVWDNSIPPGKGVRIYVIDRGLNMRHKEFASRAFKGDGGSPADFNFQWMFPKVDPLEKKWNWVTKRMDPVVTNYMDPNAAPSGQNGNLPDAYADGRNGHGTMMISQIVGDTLGTANGSDITMVKIPQYVGGEDDGDLVMYSIMGALFMIKEEIEAELKSGKMGKNIISCSFGFFFSTFDSKKQNEPVFEKVWKDFLDWFKTAGVLVVTSTGNSAKEHNRGITVDNLPARIMRQPMMVVGSVTSSAERPERAQGEDGDGVTTFSAPGQTILVAWHKPDQEYEDNPGQKVGNYVFESGTSNSVVKTVALAAYFLAFYSGSNPLPNDYAYDKITGLVYSRIPNGPKVIYNGRPAGVV